MPKGGRHNVPANASLAGLGTMARDEVELDREVQWVC